MKEGYASIGIENIIWKIYTRQIPTREILFIYIIDRQNYMTKALLQIDVCIDKKSSLPGR